MSRLAVKPRRPVIQARHPLARKLVFDLPFWERGGNPRDLVGRYPGTNTSGVSWTSGAAGPEQTYNGTNGVTTFGAVPASLMSSRSEWTLIQIASATSYTTDHCSFGINQGNTSTNRFFFAPYDNVTGNGVRVFYGTNIIAAAGPSIADGAPHVFAFVSRGPTAHEVWVDGVRVATSSTSRTLDAGLDTLNIGARTSIQQLFAGAIQLTRLYTRALSPWELRATYSDPWGLYRVRTGGAYRWPAVPLFLAATINGVGGASGALQVSRLLAGALSGQGSVTGAAEVRRLLAGAAAGVGAVNGALELRRLLAGNVSGLGATEAALRIERLLAGSADGAGDVAGSLEIRRLLTGALAGAGSAAGELEIARRLAGAVAGVGTAAAELLVSRLLAGEVFGTGTLSGELLIIAAVVCYGGSVEIAELWGGLVAAAVAYGGGISLAAAYGGSVEVVVPTYGGTVTPAVTYGGTVEICGNE